MGATESPYIAGVTVSIYLSGVLVRTGTTDVTGKYATVIGPGVYDIVLSKAGYKTITKHETIAYATELMVNLPSALPSVIVEPFPITPTYNDLYVETVIGLEGDAVSDTINKVEALKVGVSKVPIDTVNKSEAVTITNV